LEFDLEGIKLSIQKEEKEKTKTNFASNFSFDIKEINFC